MKKLIVAISCLYCYQLQGQSLSPGGFASSAGYFFNTNAQLEFNVGESVIGTLSNSNSMLSNGTLQPNFLINTIPTTQLRAIDCGKLNLSQDAQIAAIPVSGASLYHFEFKEAATGNFYGQKISSNLVVSPIMVQPSLLWNQQYSVRVKVFVNGQWSEFGPSCIIGLMQDPAIAGVAQTSIRTQYCNVSSITLNSSIVCNPVTMANKYEFKFTNTQNGNIHIYQSLTTTCQLLLVTPSLIAGVNYQVQVRAKVYTTWGNFGNNCSITPTTAQAANREEMIAENEQLVIDETKIDYIAITKITAYPNPFSELTNLLVESEKNEEAIFHIYDLQGTLIHQFVGITNRAEQINYQFIAGSYIVKVITNSAIQLQTKIFKIN